MEFKKTNILWLLPILLTGLFYFFSYQIKINYLDYFGIPKGLVEFSLIDLVNFGMNSAILILLLFYCVLFPVFLIQREKQKISFFEHINFVSFFNFLILFPIIFFEDYKIINEPVFFTFFIMCIFLLVFSFFKKEHISIKSISCGVLLFSFIQLILSVSIFTGYSLASKQDKFLTTTNIFNEKLLVFTEKNNQFIAKIINNEKKLSSQIYFLETQKIPYLNNEKIGTLKKYEFLEQ